MNERQYIHFLVRVLLLLIPFSLLPYNSPAQTYKSIRDTGLRAYDALKFEEAIIQFEAAEVLAQDSKDTKKIAEIDSLIDWAKDGYIDAILAARAELSVALKKAEQNAAIAHSQTLTLHAKEIPPDQNDRMLRLLEASWTELAQHQLTPSPPFQQRFSQGIYDQVGNREVFPLLLPAAYFPHEAKIISTQLSPDGQYILTSCVDSTTRIWDLNGNLLFAHQHSDLTVDIHFSPDNKSFLRVSSEAVSLMEIGGTEIAKLTEGSPFTQASFSPDGTHILTSSSEGIATIWDQQGKKKAQFPDVASPRFPPQFSADGQYVLNMNSKDQADLYHLNGHLIGSFGSGIVHRSMAGFSPDGKMFFTTSREEKKVSLWNLQGKLLATLDHNGGRHEIQFSSDGQNILSQPSDKTVQLWSQKGKKLLTINDRNSSITSFCFSPDGQSILTTSYDGTAKLWDIEKEKWVRTFGQHEELARSGGFSPDGSMIYSSYSGKSIKVYSIKGRKIADLGESSYANPKLVFTPDSRRLILQATDRLVKIWDFRPRLLVQIADNLGSIGDACFSPDGKYILSHSTYGTATVWDVRGTLLQDIEVGATVIQAVFSPDGQSFFSHSIDSMVRIWSLQGQFLGKIPLPDGRPVVKFSPDGKSVLTQIFQKNPQLWNLQGELISELTFDPEWGGNPVFSPDGRYIFRPARQKERIIQVWDIQKKRGTTKDFEASSITVSPNGKHYLLTTYSEFHLIDFESGKKELTLPNTNGRFEAIFSPDGMEILTYDKSWNHPFILHDLAGDTIATFEGQSPGVVSVTFSPDGKLILTRTNPGNVQLWNKEGKLLSDLDGLTWVELMCFSPDNQYIGTTSRGNRIHTRGNQIQLWNNKGERLASIDKHIGRIKSLHFSPDSRFFLSASYDGTAKLWPTPHTIYEWLQSPDCPIPPLTQEERIQYNLSYE